MAVNTWSPVFCSVAVGLNHVQQSIYHDAGKYPPLWIRIRGYTQARMEILFRSRYGNERWQQNRQKVEHRKLTTPILKERRKIYA